MFTSDHSTGSVGGMSRLVRKGWGVLQVFVREIRIREKKKTKNELQGTFYEVREKTGLKHSFYI